MSEWCYRYEHQILTPIEDRDWLREIGFAVENRIPWAPGDSRFVQFVLHRDPSGTQYAIEILLGEFYLMMVHCPTPLDLFHFLKQHMLPMKTLNETLATDHLEAMVRSAQS